ncbi:MAG TPA: nucleotidyl transferase AbiEii/AbiGii toxin family protein [Thermoanaerobaculia bacterium]|nr:nucleotidyl transferase AbiEii/AbiGii toxin family protein [Thermoanaerobaculia bacterium]
MFIRLLARLELAQPGLWVLKGGMALEIRLGDRARTTRDLDLVLCAWLDDPEAIHGDLLDALSADPAGDGLIFRVAFPSRLEARDAGAGGFRFPVEAHLAGRLFERVRVDVVPQVREKIEAERLLLPDLLGFAGVKATEVEVLDRRQHFAEKIHALTRIYGDQPSRRVKDLPDLLLLIHDGLKPGPPLREAVERLFAARATHGVPEAIAEPPASWIEDYPRLGAELDLPERSLEQALATLRSFWATLMTLR